MSLIEISLMGVIAFFVLCQIFNAILNLMTAKSFRQQWKIQLDLYEDESRLQCEQFQKYLDLNEDIHNRLDDLVTTYDLVTQMWRDIKDPEDFSDDYLEIKPKTSRKRSKYGPRKTKVIEHKEQEHRV